MAKNLNSDEQGGASPPITSWMTTLVARSSQLINPKTKGKKPNK